jgi:hypothetical protein
LGLGLEIGKVKIEIGFGPRNLTIGTLIRVAHALDNRVEELENRKWKFEIAKEATLEGGRRFAALHRISG